MSPSSNVVFCAIILTFSFHRIAFVSTFTPTRSAFDNANSTSYETAGRKPITRESDDGTSREGEGTDGDDADDNDNEENDNNHSNNNNNDDDDDDDDDDDNGNTNNNLENNGETNEFEEDKNCTCSGSGCLCCINLNLSFIDLGGPGCVKFSYMVNNDSMAVNMSYGERLLETDTLKRTSTESTCMDLFSDLAQMCAKFSDLTRVSKGVKGCLTVEPFLLGVSQTSYHVGCFNMDIQGLQPQIKPFSTVHHITSPNMTKETTDKPEENEEEELAAAISQSAEEGIAWFNNFIASVFGGESNDTTVSTESVEPLYNRTHTSVKLTS